MCHEPNEQDLRSSVWLHFFQCFPTTTLCNFFSLFPYLTLPSILESLELVFISFSVNLTFPHIPPFFLLVLPFSCLSVSLFPSRVLYFFLILFIFSFFLRRPLLHLLSLIYSLFSLVFFTSFHLFSLFSPSFSSSLPLTHLPSFFSSPSSSPFIHLLSLFIPRLLHLLLLIFSLVLFFTASHLPSLFFPSRPLSLSLSFKPHSLRASGSWGSSGARDFLPRLGCCRTPGRVCLESSRDATENESLITKAAMPGRALVGQTTSLSRWFLSPPLSTGKRRKIEMFFFPLMFFIAFSWYGKEEEGWEVFALLTAFIASSWYGKEEEDWNFFFPLMFFIAFSWYGGEEED